MSPTSTTERIGYTNSGQGTTELQNCNPKRHEDIVFAQLAPIFQAILDAVRRLYPWLQQLFTLLFQPNRLPVSERGCSSKPDNCWVSMEDAANIKKDPNKRFAESSREERNKDFNRVVHLFIAFAFSSRLGLGWDPTMTCINPDFSSSDPRKRRRYRIEVRNDEGNVKTFKTVRILADHAADSTMLADGMKDCSPEDHATLQKHLLTPYIGGRVFVDGVVDTTDGIMGNEMPELSPGSIFILKLGKTLNPLHQSCDPASAWEFTPDLSLRLGKATTALQPLPVLHHKYHYRIVFKEHGQTLFDEKSLLNVYITHTDVLTALSIIHRSGWVHKDINCGNIYFYDKGHSRGLLGDLEYVRCDATEAHQLRTNTLDSMASEVILQRWDQLPLAPEDDDEVDNLQAAPFAYNPLHDLESCWLLLVYILLRNDDAANVLSDPESVELRYKTTASLFTRRPDTTWRAVFMRDSRGITIQKVGLSESLAPAIRTVSRMATRLVRAFALAEEPYTSITIEKTFLQEMVYDKILPLINEDSPTRAEIRNIQLQTLPKVIVTEEKRKAKEDPETGEGFEAEQGPKSKKSR
ncbi:hypothetical protein J3R30DRAFT_3403679 [Lentinula aciculospora]|uniref:Fungal-type protein kinase domain-containing protein n=1 Tax=Lentinula aciculospora TaxID=153920 RepID=A0A9W9DPZ9_9AGAR|nr:hypothetical protein J3R30DRAFT_3403679 [Lentinula aciculospora]